MAVVVSNKPVLYVCPYCTKGRFTADDGWVGAVKHIQEQHNGGKIYMPRQGHSDKSPW